ncbi:MAG: hypothetical protein WDZ30_07545 [Cellvibrionaceae bacterium]
MRDYFRKILWPILRIFEGSEGPYNYRPLHRKILLVMGSLFSILSLVSLYFGFSVGQAAALVPVLVFFAAGSTCMAVGLLGSDRAVAKIWGGR